MTKYFAFGSNLDITQMNERVGSAGRVLPGTKASLKGYKLVFDKWSVNREAYAANLQWTENQNDVVEGVIYDLNHEQMKLLDQNEGCKIGGARKTNGGYQRETISVESNGQSVTVCTYTAPNNFTDPRANGPHCPSREYMQLIYNGAKAASLSQPYIKKLGEQPLKNGGSLIPREEVRVENIRPNPIRTAEATETAETKFNAGKQIGVLIRLATTSDTFTENMASKMNNERFRQNNPKTVAVLQEIFACRNLVSSPRSNEHFSSSPVTYWQQKLAEYVSQGLQKGALSCLAKGACITPEIYECYNNLSAAEHPSTIKALKPFILAYEHQVLHRPGKFEELQELCESLAPINQPHLPQ